MRCSIKLQIIGFITLALIGIALLRWVQGRSAIQQGRTLELQELREI